MVIKGKARGGPAALAKHLERHDTNERVSVRELRGVAARDVEGALREMDCMGAGAISTRTLYHAAINTAPNEHLTDAQKQQAIERLESELGFTGQPRIVVEHEKKGREHIHVVFLRIDTDRMVAIPDSHNYRHHEIVARDLEREFGHERVQGAHIGREDQNRPERTPSHDEMQQAERTGLSPKAAKEHITQLWNQADSGMAFAAAVKEQGWVLAKGDKRDYVLIDPAGEPHSLARRIEGAKAADVKRRMADVDPVTLPSVAEAKASQRKPSPAIPNKTVKKKAVDAPVSGRKPVQQNSVAPPVPKPVQTKAERLTAIAKGTVANENASPERIREKLNLKTKVPPTKLQKFYGAAARATAQVLGKAKKLLSPKTKPHQPSPPKPESKPTVAVIRPSRITASSATVIPTKVTNVVQSTSPKPERKRMAPAELDAMLGRKQARRQSRGLGL